MRGVFRGARERARIREHLGVFDVRANVGLWSHALEVMLGA
jgi:hypothetical protein